jgi:HAD superfamily hydrolase (TIGR01509 family)
VTNSVARPPPVAWAEIETVILDMDGTLLDLHFDTEVWNRLLPERFARTWGSSLEDARNEVARRLEGARGTLQWYCLDYWYAQTGIDLAALEIELAHLVRFRPGAREFLMRLKETSCQLILATNAHPTGMQRKFGLTGIDAFFDAIACSHDYGVCKEALGFWTAFTADHDIDPTAALLLDDNHAVLDAARAFGIGHLFGVRYPDTLGEQKSSTEFHCIESFDELWCTSEAQHLESSENSGS